MSPGPAAADAPGPAAAGFPPLPPGTRLAVDAASLDPPRLDLTAAPLSRWPAARVVATVLAAAAVTVGLGVWAVVDGPAEDGSLLGLMCGGSCTLVPIAVGAMTLLADRGDTSKLWLRSDGTRVEAETVWVSRSFLTTVDLAGHPARDLGVDETGALAVGEVTVTNRLAAPDREWVRAALARVRAAAGGSAANPPLLVSVTPDPDRRVRHGELEILEDGPRRLVFRLPAVVTTRRERWGPAAVTLAFVLAPLAVFWLRGCVHLPG